MIKQANFKGRKYLAVLKDSEDSERADVRYAVLSEQLEDFRWQWRKGSPVLMQNTEVKPFRADGTWLETARESRSLPDPKKEALDCLGNPEISQYSSLAQSVERSAVNRNVVGSSPT